MENEKRRRLSNLFNPPEIYDSTLELDQEENIITVDEEEEMMEISEQIATESNPSTTLRRSARKKIRTTLQEEISVPIKPVKLSAKSRASDIKKYYLDKKVKLANLALETIYEEPQVINNENVIMSTRKFKRMISFNVTNGKNPAKIKKRRLKMKNLNTKRKIKKIPLEVLKNKLEELDD